MNYYDESAKKRHKKIDVENIDIKEECGDKNCANGNTPGDINFKTEAKAAASGKSKKDIVDPELRKKWDEHNKKNLDDYTNTIRSRHEKYKQTLQDIDNDFGADTETAKMLKDDEKEMWKKEKAQTKSIYKGNRIDPDKEAKKIAKFAKAATIHFSNESADVDFETEGCSGKKCKKDVVDFETESAKSKKKKTKKDCCGSDECTDTECKKDKKSKKDDGAVDFETESCKSKKKKDTDVDFETEACSGKKCKKDVVDFETESAKSKKGKKKCTGDENCTCPDCMKKKKAGDVEIENECGDNVNFKTEACKSKKKKDADVDFETESAKCKGKKCKKNQELEIDEENLNDTKKKKKAMFDQECGDNPIPKSSKFIKEEDDADLGIDPADADINVDDISLEYMVSSLDNAEVDALNTERQVMTAMAEELYKEYLMIDYNLSDDCYAEYATDEDSDDEVVQERFFGGTGKSIANIAKPVVKGAKRINDIKHGVGRHGIIRNVIHRTKKDLHEGGTVYKLLTWPFLLLKNTVQTIYHKTKSFITYKGLLLGVEVKINREIKKLRKNFRNIPKAALAGAIGYATTTLNSMAKGEGVQLDPLEFITHEGANLIAELGHDTMLRALTNKLADAVENSPEKIRQVIAERNKGVKEKLTPSDGENASTVLSIKDNKITAEHLVNLVGINGMIDDIDRWSDICENVARDVSNGNDGNISGYLTQAKSIQDKYMDNDKVNYGIIYSKNSASVKISDFYAEFADKLVDKAKSLEKGLDKISGLENIIKDSEGQLSDTTEKTLAELNVVMQHTCNAFMEIIGTLDDLGKYVANTMNQYLNCLTAANSIKANKNAKNDNEE